MHELAYRLLNVFAIEGQRLSGNPLCVFEDGRGLDPALMQSLARQFNLSETTFILPSVEASAAVRIFTPTQELPFAGHPTLGTAHVVRALTGCGDALTLEMPAGRIPVVADEETWTLTAKAPKSRPVTCTRDDLAEMLGLLARDVDDRAYWIDAGVEQLVVPLTTVDAVRRANPRVDLLERYGSLTPDRCLVYTFAEEGPERVCARFFFKVGRSVIEDPATGSACANLGGWLLVTGAPRPTRRVIEQGEMIRRPSQLRLQVDDDQGIHVSGAVVELGRGMIRL